MMDISAAALPPRQPSTSPTERAHPLYPEYRRYVSAMSINLVEADPFDGWLRQRDLAARDEDLQAHPRFREFQRWMRDTQGGAPGKTDLTWPANFQAWLGGARW